MISTTRKGTGDRKFTTGIGSADPDGVLIVQRVEIPDPNSEHDIDVSSQVRLTESELRVALGILEG